MNYEKKYKEALEWARKVMQGKVGFVLDEVLEKFPELQESEDEEIRKFLIQMAQNGHGGDKDWWNKCVAWLEKQELKSNPYSGVSFNYNGNTWGMCARDNGVDILFNRKLIQHISDEKQGEQKPWSEEDEKHFSWLIEHLNQSAGLYDNLIIWLKSLKDRVQPQPKKEWYKEAENNILFLTSIIEECFKDKEEITLCDDTVCANFTKENVIDRLKSLSSQSTWKPSEEQLNSLYDVLNPCDGFNREVLESLYQDLKKLKG